MTVGFYISGALTYAMAGCVYVYITQLVFQLPPVTIWHPLAALQVYSTTVPSVW